MQPNVQRYQTPDGKVDFPYIYIYDATALTDGQTFQNVLLQTQGDSEFILRQIKGVDTVVAAAPNGAWNYRTKENDYPNNMGAVGIYPLPNFPVLLEQHYPKGTSLLMDFYNVSRNTTACATTIYNSYLAFCGVKRYDAPTPYKQPTTKYQFKRVMQTYQVPLTINWAQVASNGQLNPSQQFTVFIMNFDFELWSIRISQPGASGPLATNDFRITLYDRNTYATSNLPVNQGYINSAMVAPGRPGTYHAQFPSPVLVYPQGSQILFDIWSMLCSTALPQNYTLDFVGAWRMPC